MRSTLASRLRALTFGSIAVTTIGTARAQQPPATKTAPPATKAAPAKLPGTDRKPKALTQPLPDLAKTPTVFTMNYAHLDTEWNWDYIATIGQYLPKTTRENFDLFAKYPDYIFNFTGANRYRMIKEYYPATYDTLKRYVAAGRWYPAGSSMEEGDVNAPSAEAILRQFLYGNEYFRKEFGKASAEYMLPDCFGFPWSLPSLLAHAGIKGFSTQKLVWGSSVPAQASTPYAEEARGIPFNWGMWYGPDGKGVILAANPGSYSIKMTMPNGTTEADWWNGTMQDQQIPGGGRQKPYQTWNARLEENKQKLGLPVDYHYFGTGDTGGSPGDPSVKTLQMAIDALNPAIRWMSTNADAFFLAMTPTFITKMPTYASEMELQNHSAGSLTSESYIKRWIRRNETLADAAEKASVAAMWLGSRAYPMQRLNDAWTLVMGSHFHDIGAGTASVSSYNYAWNDQLISLNQFAGVLTSATSAIVDRMQTMTEGVPVVVYNPLSIEREDLVEAKVSLGTMANAYRVFGPDGVEVPAQTRMLTGRQDSALVVFSAKVPSVGYAVYDVRPSQTPSPLAASSPLRVTERSLENARYRVTINDAGDVSSIFDKKLNKELLSAPARLAFLSDTPVEWPAWNMDYDDAVRGPRGYVSGPAKISITENGPARVAVTIERTQDKSKFVQTVRLSAGDAGNRVEFNNAIDWSMDSTVLKAVFPLVASNDTASYNTGAGVIKRGNMYDRKFEVGTHQWIDITDRAGAFGATILTDAKNGSDKPDANTVRLTLINSPAIPVNRSPTVGEGGGYSYQAWQDWGHHDILYGFSGHAGDFRDGQTDWQGYRLNQPLVAFQAPTKHAGGLGKSWSLVKVSNPRVGVMALKRAEMSNEIIVRLNELDGKPQQNVRVTFASPITAAREVNGQEQPLRAATVVGGALTTSLTPFTLRTFAVTLTPPATRAAAPISQPVTLAYDLSVASHDKTQSVGGFDAEGRALPAEMLPTSLPYAGITFKLAPAMEGKPNAVVARGQSITLPVGMKRVYVLAASADGDRKATFRVGEAATDVVVQDWGGFVGQWYQRIMKNVPPPPPTPAQLAAQAQAQARTDSILRVRIDSTKRAGGDTMAVINGRGGRGGGGGGAGGNGRGGGAPRNITVLDSLNAAFVKEAPIAWYASHRHDKAGANQIYQYSYLFAYTMDIPAGAKTLTLPNDDRIRVLAVSVSNEGASAKPAQALIDTFGK